MNSTLIDKSLLRASAVLVALTFSIVSAQTPAQKGDKPSTHPTEKQEAPAGSPALPVVGGGTVGQVTKWTGFPGSSSFIGDSIITETKDGNIGISALMPGSKLTVAGTVEATLGGFKFPDASVQTTAGLASVFHDASLFGSGASASPLGIAPGGVNTIHLATGAVTGPKIANGSVVRSLNGLFDTVNLLPGSNVMVTPAGNTLTISAPNLLSSIARDATLTGNGTTGSPLGVASQGIGTAQLADNAVTTAKIAAGQVGTAQLANNSVTTAQLADNAVTATQIAAGQVGTAQLATNAVTAAKVAPGQVVKAINGITDNITIVAGANLAIVPESNLLTITAPFVLTSIAHDASLTGNGTSTSPLTVAPSATPALQPVAFSDSVTLSDPDQITISGTQYVVPQGQTLVIQQLAVTLENASFVDSAIAFLIIDIGPGGVVGGSTLPIILTLTPGYTAPFPSNTAFGASLPVTIYCHSGQTVQFGGMRGNHFGNSLFRWYFFGYLTPAP